MRAVHTRFTLTAVQSRQTRRPAPCWHPVSAAAHSLARLRHAPFHPRLNTKWSGNALGLADCRASGLACCLSTGSGFSFWYSAGARGPATGPNIAPFDDAQSSNLDRLPASEREKREKKKGTLSVLSVHAPLLCFGRLSPSSTRRSFISSHQPHHHLSTPNCSWRLSHLLHYSTYTTVPLLLLSTHLIFTSHQISSLFTISYLPSRERAPNPDRPN